MCFTYAEIVAHLLAHTMGMGKVNSKSYDKKQPIQKHKPSELHFRLINVDAVTHCEHETREPSSSSSLTVWLSVPNSLS